MTTPMVTVDIEDLVEVNPFTFLVSPNPISSHTQIHFTQTGSGEISLEVYDLLGQKVATLLENQMVPVGPFVFDWKLDNSEQSINSGIYIIRLHANGIDETVKVLVE